jgi:hypothetical protein
MTKKSRYFLIAAAAVLVIGLGGGLIAYLGYKRASGLPAGVPAEVRYVPADAALVGYANVRSVMSSELRRELMPTIEAGSRKGRQMMDDFAGVDLERQVDHIVGYVERPPAEAANDAAATARPPRAVLMVQGSFEQARIEQFIRERGGTIGDYRGHHIAVHRESTDGLGIGFIRPDLMAVGQADLVRRVIDAEEAGADKAGSLTTNGELMELIRESAGSTAWMVGYFEAVSRGMRLPGNLATQVPPVRLIAARAEINGGVRATVRADTADNAAADQLRDVVRGFLALARIGAGSKPELDSALKSIQLSGADKTVRLTFAVSPEAMRALAPRPRP